MTEGNSKIRNYVNVLFTDVPRSKRAIELKEELLSDMNERYRDYIAQGRSENEAYSQTVASMTDIDELLAEVTPGDDFRREAQFYRERNAKWTGIAVAMYILGAAALIGCSVLWGDGGAITGLILLLVLCAAATGLLIYFHGSTPIEYRDFDEQQEQRLYSTPKGRRFKNTKSIYWSIATALYLLISFLTMRWDISWIIWPIAGVLSSILDSIYAMRNDSNER